MGILFVFQMIVCSSELSEQYAVLRYCCTAVNSSTTCSLMFKKSKWALKYLHWMVLRIIFWDTDILHYKEPQYTTEHLCLPSTDGPVVAIFSKCPKNKTHLCTDLDPDKIWIWFTAWVWCRSYRVQLIPALKADK